MCRLSWSVPYNRSLALGMDVPPGGLLCRHNKAMFRNTVFSGCGVLYRCRSRTCSCKLSRTRGAAARGRSFVAGAVPAVRCPAPATLNADGKRTKCVARRAPVAWPSGGFVSWRLPASYLASGAFIPGICRLANLHLAPPLGNVVRRWGVLDSGVRNRDAMPASAGMCGGHIRRPVAAIPAGSGGG